MFKKISLAVVVLFVVSTFFGLFFTVQPGEIAFTKTFGKLGSETYTEGMYIKMPIFTSSIKMNTQIQKLVVEGADSSSKDLQSVMSDIAVNYRIKGSEARSIYQNIGNQSTMESTLIIPAVEEGIKKATSEFTAEQLITKRQEVRSSITQNLKDKLEIHGLDIVDVNIVDFSFSPEFDAAIEEKVKAEQQALTEKNRLESIKFKAEQKVVQATAEAEAIRIQAQAITQQGGAAYVDLKWIEKWNGQLPQVQSAGNGGGVFVDVRK